MLRRILAIVLAFTFAIGQAGAITPYPKPMMMKAASSSIPSPVFSHDYTTSQTLAAEETFSASGQRTMFDSTGKLTYGPNNILLNTATLSTQSVTTAAINYVLSIKGTGSVTLSGTSTAGPLNGTGASNRVNLAFTPTAGTLTLTVSGSVTDARLSAVTYETTMRTIDDVNTTGSAYYGPRFDYDASGPTAIGLLLEAEARTNLFTYSEQLNLWSTSGISVTSDSTTAPSGVAVADTLDEGTGSGRHILYQSANVDRTLVRSVSAFYKAGTAQYAYLWSVNGGDDGFFAMFDMTGGTVSATTTNGTGGLSGSGIEDVGNGWYRCWVSGYINASAGTDTIYTGIGASDRSDFTGTLTSGKFPSYTGTSKTFYAFGGVWEIGVSPSAYIPAVASSVTRAAETLSIDTSGFGLSSAYTLVAQHDVAYGNNNSGNAPEYLNGVVSGANAFDMYWGDATHIGASVTSTAPTAYTVSASDSTAAGAVTKYAFAVDNTQPKISVGGAASVNIGSWSGTPRIPTSSINVGNYLSAGYENPSAHYAYLAIYNSALYSNLQTLSTP